MARVLFIPADSNRVVSLMDTDGSLDAFQRLVGGTIQVITLDNVGQHSLYFNEEGKLLHLPLNPRATLLFYRGVGITDDNIVGDAFLAGPVDEDGNDSDVNPDVVQLARSM